MGELLANLNENFNRESIYNIPFSLKHFIGSLSKYQSFKEKKSTKLNDA